MEWLNSVKSAQGSVEVTSMRQAEAINSVGIYVVGKIGPNLTTDKPVSFGVYNFQLNVMTSGRRVHLTELNDTFL